MSDLNVPPPSAADPVASLYKMSGTAGVSGSSYVAVNNACVAAALLGLASGLAVIASAFVILPVAGIACGIVGWRQVRRSAGTQTGIKLALLGILLSVLVGGGVVAYEGISVVHAQRDQHELAARIEELGRDVMAERYDDAYAMFDSRVRGLVSVQQFARIWRERQQPNEFGKLLSMRWNEVSPQYEIVRGGTTTRANMQAIIRFQNAEDHFKLAFVQEDGQWKFDLLQSFFWDE